MSTIQIPESEVWEAIETGHCIDCGSWRWGTEKTYVFEKEPGRFYRFTVRFHSVEGLQADGPVEAVEVREVEKTVKAWEAVT